MKTLLLSLALFGEVSPQVQRLIDEKMRQDTEMAVQAREAATQNQIAYDNRQSEDKQTYIIGGAIVVGLVLLGLIARSKK